VGNGKTKAGGVLVLRCRADGPDGPAIREPLRDDAMSEGSGGKRNEKRAGRITDPESVIIVLTTQLLCSAKPAAKAKGKPSGDKPAPRAPRQKPLRPKGRLEPRERILALSVGGVVA
jgi:hypothetical protein